MEQTKFNDLRPKVVLGVAAHPDDLDFGASGAMAKFAQSGADVYYLILTDGGSGTEDRNITPVELTKIRHEEQRNAGRVLGLKDVFFCDYHDGTLQNTPEVKRDIVKIIRQVKPNVVVTMDPSVLYAADLGFINHPDHRAAGQATLDAVFPLARDHLSFPELFRAGYLPHKTKTVLLTNFEHSNFYVDITPTFDKKMAALKAHASQVPDTKITDKFIKDMAHMAGKKVGYELAESFVRIDIRQT